MKDKYLLIFLLIITFICAFCKYSKNLEVKELFNSGSNIDSNTNLASKLDLDNFDNLDINCALNTNTPGGNLIDGNIDGNIEKIKDIYTTIKDTYITTKDDMNVRYINNINTLQSSWNRFKADNELDQLKNETITINTHGSNVCETHIKPHKISTELEETIQNVLDDNKWTELITDIEIENQNFTVEKNALITSLGTTEEHYKTTYTTIKDLFTTLQSDINTIKEVIINDTVYLTTLNETKTAFESLINNLEIKRDENNATISTINSHFSASNNFNNDIKSSLFQGIDNSDDSIKRHCNISGLMGGSGICHDDKDYQGCFIDCKIKDSNDKCVSSSDIGYPNPVVYTNVFGSSINIHNHSHNHPGSHPKHDDKVIYNNSIETQSISA